MRGRLSEQPVTVNLGRFSVPADYVGAQPEFPGLDQINVVLPRTLAGIGEVSISVNIGGIGSNIASVTFQ